MVVERDDKAANLTSAFGDISDDPSENVYLNAAARLGIPYRPVRGANKFWLLGESPTVVWLRGAALGVNPSVLFGLLRDKAACQSLLAEHGFPVPEFLFLEAAPDWASCSDRCLAFARSRFPVVVKPNGGSQAIGVYTDIRGEPELLRVLGRQMTRGIGQLMVERHIPGSVHRAIVFDGRLVDVVRWQMSTIEGDGKRTARELVAELNAQGSGYREIELNARMVEILDKHGLRPDSVVPSGRRLQVVDAGIARGASRHRIPLDSIPRENHELLGRLCAVLGARLLGVDVICADMTAAWTGQEFRINEVNGSPGFGLSYPGGDPGDIEQVSGILRLVFKDRREVTPSGSV